MNDDALLFDFAEYIHSRFDLKIRIDFQASRRARDPARELALADEQVLNTSLISCRLDERYTVRDGVNIARFALKLASSESVH